MPALSNPPRVDQLVPTFVSDVDMEALYLAPRPIPDRRPYVILGMIASVDGATWIDHESGALGNASDRRALRAVRACGDVIIVGAGTAIAEGYGMSSVDGQRIGIASNTGRLDYETELFSSGAGFVLAPRSAPIPDGIDVVRAGDSYLDVAAAVAALPDVLGDISIVVAEGGPTFNGSLLDANLFDEVCVTTSPTLIGGSSHRIIHDASQTFRRLVLAHLLADSDGYLFARWIRRHDGDTAASRAVRR